MNLKIIVGAGIAILILFATFFFPRQLYAIEGTSLKTCNCLYFKTKNLCFGPLSNCTIVSMQQQAAVDEKAGTLAGIDLILLIDKSSSMMGERLFEAKHAAEMLVDEMSDTDRMSIIAFDNKSNVIQGFTSNKAILKDKISGITPGKSTEYIPPLTDAFFAVASLDKSRPAKIIFLSDGEPKDATEESVIYEKVTEVLEQGACFYSVGHHIQEGHAETILKNMGLLSKHRNGCGGYYSTFENRDSLGEIFQRVYNDTSSLSLRIDINSPSRKVYNESRIRVNFSTNIDSFCRYSLNLGDEIEIESHDFMISAQSGRNILTIKCERFLGKYEAQENSIDFFVDFKPQLIPDVETKKKIVMPDDKDIKKLMEFIISEEKFKIVGQATPKGDLFEVAYVVRNTKPINLKNAKVRQYFKISFEDLPEFQSDHSFSIVQESPLILEFHFPEVKPDEIIAFSYSFKLPRRSFDINSVRTEVVFDKPSSEDIEYLIDKAKSSRNAVEVKREVSYQDGKTSVNLGVTPKESLGKTQIILSIPKCMALRLNKLYFHNTNFRVISDDPIVLWNFDSLIEDTKIVFEADGIAHEDCIDELTLLPISETVTKTESGKDDSRIWMTLLPFILTPILIVIYIIDKVYLESKYRKTSAGSKIVILFLFFGVLFFLLYPKNVHNEGQVCSCYGIKTPDKCYGFVTSCQASAYLKESIHSYCDMSCSDFTRILYKTDGEKDGSGSTKVNDITLILDRSKSMEKDKMAQAKMALGLLIRQIREGDRISLIQFDNNSEVVSQFTADKEKIINDINKITLGEGTSYVPALDTAYYNNLFYADKDAKQIIIFVSDGEPFDQGRPDSIYRAVSLLASTGVCINTIGFGQDIRAGSTAESILSRMAEISFNLTGCGKYYYSPKDIGVLTESFEQAYLESKAEKEPIELVANLNSYKLTSKEALFLDVMPLNFSVPSICNNPLSISLRSVKGGLTTRYTLDYDAQSNRYQLRLLGLEPGTYNLLLDALPNVHESNCSIKVTKELGMLEIEPSTDFHACQAEDCEIISTYLSADTKNKIVEVYITDFEFIPKDLNISPGTTVVWKNIGRQNHSVTSAVSNSGLFFSSGVIEPGGSFNFTFDVGGNYLYYDNFSGFRGIMLDKEAWFEPGFLFPYNETVDITLLIDHSESMVGDKLEAVKNATKRLISFMSPLDRISIISFSDSAIVLNEFTDQSPIILSQIDRIVSIGSTRYIPALRKAAQGYENTNSTNKVVILFSDGEPWDEGAPDSIYQEIRNMVEDGICVFAVGYGDEIYPGSRGEQILKHIVEISRSSTKCGRYLYSQSNETSISKIFGSIYNEARFKVKGLEVYPRLSRSVVSENESIILTAKIKSSFNENFLPGSSSNGLCSPPANVIALFREEERGIILTKNMDYVGESTGYIAEVSGLGAGKYTIDFLANSAAYGGKECGFEGAARLELVVLPSKRIEIDYGFLGLVSVSCLFFIYLIFRKSGNKPVEDEGRVGLDNESDDNDKTL
ncbi:MAG: VWA domain-containing protein [Candidatus Woesearchaeota archaeon]